MRQREWKVLHDWLFRVFPADKAKRLWRSHVAVARHRGAELPGPGIAK